MKDDRLYLDHILERIALIEEFTREGRSAFEESARTREAVLRCLEIIGEAARKLSEDSRKWEDRIPWDQIIALRNALILRRMNMAVFAAMIHELAPGVEVLIPELFRPYELPT